MRLPLIALPYYNVMCWYVYVLLCTKSTKSKECKEDNLAPVSSSTLLCPIVLTLFRNQIQLILQVTPNFSSNYHFLYIYESFQWIFKIFHWVPFEKRPFLAVFGRFCVFGPFSLFFWSFLGVSHIFWSGDIIGGHHSSILFFALFHFLPFFAIFGPFLHFWVIFAFLSGFKRTSELYNN